MNGVTGGLACIYFQFYIKIGVGHATGASDPSNTFRSFRDWKEKGDPEGPSGLCVIKRLHT